MHRSLWPSLTLALAAACDSSADRTAPPDPPPTAAVAEPGGEHTGTRASRDVHVTNSAAQAVPTRAVGTTTVAGSVAASQAGAWNVAVSGGTVGAAQAGPWSVGAVQSGPWSIGARQEGPWAIDVASAPPVTLAPGQSVDVSQLPPVTIAGTPAVTIAGTPAVTIAGTPPVLVANAVHVANGEADPVAVRVVDHHPPVPWVGGGQLLIDPGEEFESAQFFVVPPGKYLVVEQISIDAAVPDDQIAYEATLLATAGTGAELFRLPLAPRPRLTNQHERFGAFEQVRINVRAGAGVIVAVARTDDTGLGLASVALSGQLHDLP